MSGQRLGGIFTLSLLIFGLACSDDTAGTLDGGAADRGVDQAAADQTVRPDAGGDKAPAPDDGRGSEASVDQAATVDQASTVDQAAKVDQAVKVDQGPTPDAWVAACSGVQCKVHDDCCVCQAVTVGTTLPLCPIPTCKQNTCAARGFKHAFAYCAKGHCLLGEGVAASCTTNLDCKLVNDCCSCMALPKAMTTPACAIKTCLVPTCFGKGLSTANPTCVGGVCKLVP